MITAVDVLLEHSPWLIAMAVLTVGSAFFSSSEAALFYLTRRERSQLSSGNRAQQIAAGLLADPDRLLTAVLFWNLTINISFFSIASIVSLKMRDAGHATQAGLFAFGSLMTLIFFSELLPKSLAVIRPRALSAMVGVPLAASVRALDPVIGIFQTANLLSRRVIWPGFKPEPYLAISDLERAVELSTDDAHLVEQERAVLQNIVSLSEIRVDELMRPRIQFMSFRPPVALADLKGRMPPSGYLLVTEPDSEEVAAAIALNELSELPEEHLERYAEEVLYVPWSTTVGATLEELRAKERRVAAVVNEFGETIGILTLDDILDTIFTPSPSRSERILNREPIQQVSDNLWHVTGMTSLRRLGRFFHYELPASKSVTLAGVLQETLQRLPALGDQCVWGPFRFKVIDVPERGQLVVELTAKDREATS